MYVRVVNLAGLFESGLGPKVDKNFGLKSSLKRTFFFFFFFGVPQYNQNNLATFLNFLDLTKLSVFLGMIWPSN